MARPEVGFGIVGLGMIAEFHAAALQAMTGGRLVACQSATPGKAEAFAGRHGGRAYTDMAAFLADDALDAVIIATPSGAHLEPALAALAAGRHVVVEKPVEVTTAKVDRMIAAADAAGLLLAGIFPRRFNPATDALKAAVAAGRFGRIASADAYVKWWRPQSYYDADAWRGTWALDGGGALMNQAIHTVDLLLHVMGDVKCVRAETRLVAHAGIEVEDAAMAMLEFQSGAVGVLQATTAAWSKDGHQAEVHVMGDGGSAILADDRFRVWEFAEETPDDDGIRLNLGQHDHAAGAGAADPKAIDFSWHQRNLEDVVRAIGAGAAALIDGREARRAVALIEAIYASAKAGGEKIEIGSAQCT